MGNYIVSARKYRPETFNNVIGQPSITTTLKNAIKNRQLAHAYLFCGPRGVGKTTCARIFAKTINCYNITENIEACNECESCLSFNSSRSFNIHELDAASNNSVEDIRNLIDQVRIPPQVGKYSIYIIDEVHMLSASAFNAFLKTLEEPPAHAIFILATTEKHKIIPTILSRCQIFDFNRIKISDMVAHLERIAKVENLEADPEGLNIIAQKADGAMRDALSIFDQIASFSGGQITYLNVIENLNVLDYDYYFRLTDGILNEDTPGVLMIFDEVLDKGFDGHNFINGLSRHFRDLLVCRDEVTLQLLEVGAGIRDKYKSQSKACSPNLLINALSLTNQCDLSFRSSKNQRLHVELCLIQLCGLMTAEKKKSESQRDDSDTPGKVTGGPEKGQGRHKNLEKPSGERNLNTGKKPQPAEGGTKTIKGNSGGLSGTSPEGKRDDAANVKERERSTPGTSPEGKRDDAANVKERERSTPGISPEGKRDDTADVTESTGPSYRTSHEESHGVTPYEKDSAASPSGTSTERTSRSYDPENSHTFSIKDALKGTPPVHAVQEEAAGAGEEPPDEEEAATYDNEDFTEKELNEQWRKFANQIRDDHPRLYNTLMANKPEVSGGSAIRFEVTNPLQQEALNKIKPDLLSHLKHELNNNLTLELYINETATLQENRLFTPEDKYEHMLKKNPHLARFRQQFNLDFE